MRGLRMAERTILEKAGVAVGFGLAAASDAAGAIKSAIEGAVTAVGEVLEKAPSKEVVKKAVAKKAAKKAPAKKIAAKKAPAKKVPAKKAATKKAAAKKAPAKKAAVKMIKKSGR
jgi:hypothetical protein